MPGRSSAPKPEPTTRDQVLDVAERLAQMRGFNGFSYADIAAELGITKASLHYHFRTKTELGCAIIERYGQRFRAALAEISATGRPASRQLEQYVQLYAGVLAKRPVVLVRDAGGRILDPRGAHAAQRSADSSKRTRRGWRDCWNRDVRPAIWPSRVRRPRPRMRSTSTLEGAMLLARSYGDAGRFATASGRLLREFASAPGELRTPARTTPRARATARRRR